MPPPVKLKDIIEGLEFQSDEGLSHLNTTTGEMVYVTEEELRAALVKKSRNLIKNPDEKRVWYIELYPKRRDI